MTSVYTVFPKIPASQTPDLWCMISACSLTCMMWTGMKTQCLQQKLIPVDAWSTLNSLRSQELDTYSLWCFHLVGAEGSSEVRAVSAPKQQWSSCFTGEEALWGEEEVCRWTDFHGEGAAHTPSSTFPEETSLILFSRRGKCMICSENIRISPELLLRCDTEKSGPQIPSGPEF